MVKYLDFSLSRAWDKKDLEGKINLAKEMTVDWNRYYKILSEEFYWKNIHKMYVGDLKHDGNGKRGLVYSLIELLEKNPKDINYLHSLNRALYSLLDYLRHVEVFLYAMELEDTYEK